MIAARILSVIGLLSGMAWIGLFFMATSIGAKAPTAGEYLSIMWPGLVALATGFGAQWLASSRPAAAIMLGLVSVMVGPTYLKVAL